MYVGIVIRLLIHLPKKKKKIFPHPCMFGWKRCYQKLFLCYKLIWTIPFLLGIVPTSLLWPNFLLLWAFLPSYHTMTTVVTTGISFQRGLAIAIELWLRGTLSLAIPRRLGSNGVASVKHILLRSMLFQCRFYPLGWSIHLWDTSWWLSRAVAAFRGLGPAL